MSSGLLANIPVRIVDAAAAIPSAMDAPYNPTPPGLRVDQIADGVYYTFNYDNPAGVHLVNKTIAETLERIISSNGNAAQATSTNSEFPPPNIDRILNGGSSTKAPIQTYWVNLTESCNLGCFYCYIPDIDRYQSAPRRVISDINMNKLIDSALDDCILRDVRRLHFKLAGGEPTLAIDAMRVFCEKAVRACNKCKIVPTFGVITNGTRIDQEFIALASRYKIRVSISVDGFGATHDRIRHLGNAKSKIATWPLVEAGVDRLLDSGQKPYFLHTLTPANLDGLDELQGYLHGKGLGFRISLMRLPNAPSPATIIRFREKLIAFYRRLGDELPLNLKIETHARFAEWNPARRKLLACGSGRNYHAVDTDGNIATCQMNAANPLGRIGETSMALARSDAVTNPATAVLMDPGSRSGGCASCFFRYSCTGGCPQHTASTFGTMHHSSPWCHVYGAVIPHYIHSIAKTMYRRALKAQFVCHLPNG